MLILGLTLITKCRTSATAEVAKVRLVSTAATSSMVGCLLLALRIIRFTLARLFIDRTSSTMVTSAVIKHKGKDNGYPFERETMVKKIRRRVNKSADAAENESLNLPEGIEEEEGFVADLERFAEDSFTRSLVDGLKVIHRYRKGLVILVIVGLGFFAFNQLNTLTEQEDLGTASQTLDKALNALEAAQGPDPLKQAREDDAQKALTADEVTAKLTVAAKTFGQLDDTALVGQAGQASAFFALGDHGKALTLYKSASASSGKDALMLAVALNGEAAVLEDSGKPDEAIQVWKRLAALDKEK